MIDELSKNRKAGLHGEDGMMKGQQEAEAEKDREAAQIARKLQQDAGKL